jgi:hypothetical protein
MKGEKPMDETTTTVETTDSEYEEFEAAFDGDDGYQTDTEEQPDETPQEAEGGDTGTEATDSENPGEEDPAGDDGGEQNPPGEETSFTLRVNKEDKVVTREEMFTLAQKGMDYDRVKEQLTERDATIAQLQQKLDGSQPTMDMLEMISTETGVDIPQLLDQMHIHMRMQKGESEAEAKANIRAIKAERKLSAQEKAKEQKPAKPDNKAKAEQELTDFRNRFPGVQLDEKMLEAIKPDVLKGMSLADAYQKQQLAQKDAEIAELKRQAAAAEQNRKNRAKSPGSQKDAGGKKTKSEFDDFMTAFQ